MVKSFLLCEMVNIKLILLKNIYNSTKRLFYSILLLKHWHILAMKEIDFGIVQNQCQLRELSYLQS